MIVCGEAGCEICDKKERCGRGLVFTGPAARAAAHRSAEEPEQFLETLPRYVLGKLGSFSDPAVCHTVLKAFSDLLIEVLYFQADRLKSTYFSYLGRQAVVTFTEFQRHCSAHAERFFAARAYTPVVLLADAEPLLYPLLGLLPETGIGRPLALGFSRLSLLTGGERLAFDRVMANKRSVLSRAALARNGRLYRYLTDSSGRGTARISRANLFTKIPDSVKGLNELQ